eukprot:3854628-Pyramimonas_sp.AAC.1
MDRGRCPPQNAPVPPRSAAAILDFQWKRDPSLIHAPLIHVFDRLTPSPWRGDCARGGAGGTARGLGPAMVQDIQAE